MERESPDTIRLRVQEHYSGVARATGETCCGPASCCSPEVSEGAAAGLPAAAVASARGCGNPLALAELQQGETVLDLGSGGGLDVLLAAQRVGNTGFVYGLDANLDMLALARRNAAEAGAHNVRFLHGDLERIPLPDQSIDVILSNCVINLTPDKPRALSEALRVLRPGGRLAVSDIVIDPDLDGFPLSAEAIRRRLDWASCSAGALTRHQLQDALAAAGFESIRLEITHRGSPGDLSLLPAQSWDPLTPDQAGAVAERFVSMSISARRPGPAA
jgi:arsenite methyltransferase